MSDGQLIDTYGVEIEEQKPIRLKKNAQLHNEVTLKVSAAMHHASEIALFNRLSVVFTDTLWRSLEKELDGYYVERSPVERDGDTCAFSVTFHLSKSTTSATVKEVACRALDSLNEPAAIIGIKKHFSAFSTHPQLYSSLLDYYRTTEVITGAKQLNDSFSEKILSDLVERISVSIKNR